MPALDRRPLSAKAALLALAMAFLSACGGASTTVETPATTTAPPATSSTTESSTTTRPPATTTTRITNFTGPDGYGVIDCPPATGVTESTRTFGAPFKRCIDANKTYVATIVTNLGTLTVNLDPKAAPRTVNNFVALARHKFYDGLSCHRIIPGFVAQCGDPLGTGTGGPGFVFVDELPKAGSYKIGSVAMANAGPNTNGSQFFIITGPQGVALPPAYTLFGTVVNSESTIKALDAAGNTANNGVPPKQAVRISSVVIVEK